MQWSGEQKLRQGLVIKQCSTDRALRETEFSYTGNYYTSSGRCSEVCTQWAIKRATFRLELRRFLVSFYTFMYQWKHHHHHHHHIRLIKS